MYQTHTINDNNIDFHRIYHYFYTFAFALSQSAQVCIDSSRNFINLPTYFDVKQKLHVNASVNVNK